MRRIAERPKEAREPRFCAAAPVRPRRRPYRPRHAHPAEHEAEKKNGAKDALLLQSLVSARGDVTTHARRIDPGSSGDEGDTI